MKKDVVILFFPLVDRSRYYSNFPFSILYLERMLRESNIEVVLIDERLNPDYQKTIKSYKERILLVGVSAIIGYQAISGIRFSKFSKTITDAPIIWGGWFPTIFTEVLLKENYVDFICSGQGEFLIKELVNALINNISIENIENLSFKKNKELFIKKPGKLFDSFSLPAPDYSLVNVDKLININGIVDPSHRGIDYQATIGCPHECYFCNLVFVFESKWFSQKTEVIIEDMILFKAKHNVKNVTFCDDNFFSNKKFIISFCEKVIQNNIDITWEANAHVSSFLHFFKEAEVELMYKAGCRKIKIGVESGDQEVLDRINKKCTVEQNIEIVRLLKKYKIAVQYFTMVCFPFNPEKDFNNTLKMIGKAKTIYPELEANINYFIPIPGTQLYPIAQSYGFSFPENMPDLIEFISNDLKTPWFKDTYKEKLRYFIEFYFRFAKFGNYRNYYGLKKVWMFLVSLRIYPICYFRMKTGFFALSFDAWFYLKLFNRKNKPVDFDFIESHRTKKI